MTKANECTCPSGNGSLRHPCPAHPAVEQAGGDERAAFEAAASKLGIYTCNFERYTEETAAHENRINARVEDPVRAGDYRSATLQDCWKVWQEARAALAQPSPALPPFAEKVLAKLRRFYDCAEDFESGGVDIGRHWLDLLTQLGLLNRVQRSPAFWEISQQGEDLLGMPQPSPAQAEQAEAERPEVVARVVHSNPVVLGQCGPLNANDELMTVAQHAASVARWAEMFNRVEQERDAALARCAELEAKLSDPTAVHQWQFSNAWFDCSKEALLKAGKEGSPIRTLYTAPAQAQHSVPETTNEEANSFLRVADAGQFKDNAAAVRTAAMIIRGLLHRPAIMKSIIRHRIGLTPEYEGQWHADMYGEDGEVQHHAEADTPDEAVRAVVALAAAPGKEGV